MADFIDDLMETARDPRFWADVVTKALTMALTVTFTRVLNDKLNGGQQIKQISSG
jgi:hypothetical protein